MTDPQRAVLERLIAGRRGGAALAAELGLGRGGVWKRIQGLRAAGVDIRADRRHGYSLARPLELLDAAAIGDRLPAATAARISGLEVAWSLDSTNAALLRRPHDRDDRFAILLAEGQTDGRGRRGRSWASPLAANLYLSLSRRFDAPVSRLGGMSVVAGVAIAGALHALGAGTVAVKWPNDLVAGGAKLGGVLVEFGGELGGPVQAVVGVGLNVSMPAHVGEAIDQAWTDLGPLGARAGRNRIAAALIQSLVRDLDRFDAEGFAAFRDVFSRYDGLCGRRVQVVGAGPPRVGRALGIAADGALRLREDDGRETQVYSGEVSVRSGPGRGSR